MINITYALKSTDIAERMQKDLSIANTKFDPNILLVLVTPESMGDSSVLRTISTAINHQHVIVPVILEQADLPDNIAQLDAVDFTSGYDEKALIPAIRKAVTGHATRRKNIRYGWGVFAIIMASFVISMIGLASGYIGVPVDEFATEAAIQERMIETLTFPTLDPLMPRTTEDAQNFPRTVEAANTRNAPLLMMTATALPRNIEATQTAFFTIEAATSTARAQATESAGD